MTSPPFGTILVANREKYNLLRDGVLVSFRNAKGELIKKTLHVFDFADATQNSFLAVRELAGHSAEIRTYQPH